MKTDNNATFGGHHPLGGGFMDQFPVDGGGGGFMQLLGLQDFGSEGHVFDFPETTPMSLLPQQPDSSEVVNFPATPNESSVSSSSTETPLEPVPAKGTSLPEGEGADDQDEEKKSAAAASNGGGGKKKARKKRQRAPRFAFLTKSEVDHLEDGYRWRKYGQKAVKNSPFPRSYHRCTTAMCGVKKQVERSSKDPAVVITTYEGQHTHPSPAVLPRGAHFLLHAPPPQFHAGHAPQLHGQFPLLASCFSSPALPSPWPLDFCGVAPPSHRQRGPMVGSGPIRDHGLLQDLIPSNIIPKLED